MPVKKPTPAKTTKKTAPQKKKPAQAKVQDPEKKTTGRPTAYKPEYDKLAFNYTLLGATDKDLAKYFEVEEKTINNWKLSRPSFLQSIKSGKEDADAKVAGALYKRATGYRQKIEKPMVVSVGDYVTEIQIAQFEEKVKPDVAAAFIWLKNRQPNRWRDKPKDESGGDDLRLTIDFTE